MSKSKIHGYKIVEHPGPNKGWALVRYSPIEELNGKPTKADLDHTRYETITEAVTEYFSNPLKYDVPFKLSFSNEAVDAYIKEHMKP